MKELDGGLWLSKEDLIELGWFFRGHEVVVGNTNALNYKLHRIMAKRKEFYPPMPNETLAKRLACRPDGLEKEFFKLLVLNTTEEIPDLGEILGIVANVPVETGPNKDNVSV